MNIRYKVYYYKSQEEKDRTPDSWSFTLPNKLIRAKNPDKAMEIFKLKHPDLIPAYASLY